MILLAVESSCDETAVALVQDGRTVLADCIASSVEMHKIYGGVVPEIASRKHIEVISQLANGVKRPDLVAGICRSVASRVAALARRAGVTERVCLSGGVAQNDAVRQALSDELNVPVSVDPLAQYFGAIGAALWAYKQQV